MPLRPPLSWGGDRAVPVPSCPAAHSPLASFLCGPASSSPPRTRPGAGPPEPVSLGRGLLWGGAGGCHPGCALCSVGVVCAGICRWGWAQGFGGHWWHPGQVSCQAALYSVFPPSLPHPTPCRRGSGAAPASSSVPAPPPPPARWSRRVRLLCVVRRPKGSALVPPLAPVIPPPQLAHRHRAGRPAGAGGRRGLQGPWLHLLPGKSRGWCFPSFPEAHARQRALG